MQLIADVVGYYQKAGSDDESRAGRVRVPLASPFRAIETRAAGGGDGVKLGPGQEDTWDFQPFVDLADTPAAPSGRWGSSQRHRPPNFTSTAVTGQQTT